MAIPAYNNEKLDLALACLEKPILKAILCIEMRENYFFSVQVKFDRMLGNQ